MKYILPAMIFGTGLLLTSCETLDDDINRFEAMSCYELAKETGRYEQKFKRADTEETFAVLDQIFSDNKKEEDKAETDEFIASLDKDAAKRRLDELNRISRNKGCR